MELNSRCLRVITFGFCSILLIGCTPISNWVDWTSTESLEEYGDQVAKTVRSLQKHIGKSSEDIRRELGEPTKIVHRNGSKYISVNEKVQFDEIWDYTHMEGMPMINAKSGSKLFYFKDGFVVAVDAN